MAIFILSRVDFRTKKSTRNTKGHYIMTKGSIHQDTAILNVYISESRAANYRKQKPVRN